MRYFLFSFIYSCLLLLVVALLFGAAVFSKNIRRQLKGRSLLLARVPKAADKHWVFFCSSAGEYEQAKPLIDKITANRLGMPLIFFFSRSGFEFATARKEQAYFAMAPFDFPWLWQVLYRRLKNPISIVVRHELWPGFCLVSKQHGLLGAIDVNTGGAASPWTNRSHWLTRRMLRIFDFLCVVSPADKRVLVDKCRVSEHRVVVAGDTKYDRAADRVAAASQKSGALKEELERLLGPHPKLVVGSAWPPDAKLIVAAHQEVQKHHAVRSVLVPHDISEDMLQTMEAICTEAGLKAHRYGSKTTCVTECDVVIVGTMGMLAELYSCASYAFVGGGLHHRVHNVLEPSVYGIPVAFGPKFRNSFEAVQLVENGMATVVSDRDQCVKWWLGSGCSSNETFVSSMLGASERILAAIKATRGTPNHAG